MASEANFTVPMPEEYDEDDRNIFKDSIETALTAIVEDANMDVQAARVLRSIDEVLGRGTNA